MWPVKCRPSGFSSSEKYAFVDLAVPGITLIKLITLTTRQLSSRKEDRVMRPIYGCSALKSFESPHYAPTTFPEICNGL